MDAEQLKDDIRTGRIDLDQVIELIVSLQSRIEELERQVRGSGTVKVDEPFSVESEESRQAKRGRKPRKHRRNQKRRGRVSTADKLAKATRVEQVFPEGVPADECRISHTRVVWRLEGGQAQLVAYEVYRKGNSFGIVPGTLGRSEFGLELVVSIAYQVFMVGLSFDKVCLLMKFFQNLDLKKSQVDALLNRLAREWEQDFDWLCVLLANSLVVHADETSWSINSVWAFLSEKARLLLFGVPKDAATLKELLDPETFAGLVISDDAAVYATFTNAQKCWAHLLRKAIRLTLLEPRNQAYRRFADGLLDIYREACRVRRDGRLSDGGRQRKVQSLDDSLVELCGPMWFLDLPPGEGPEDDYRRLVNEVMRLMLARELFRFVTTPDVKTPAGESRPVPGTNNEAERSLRASAQARKTCQTSKTLRGARRRTIITSILESLRPSLPEFTLASVIEEILLWGTRGASRFRELASMLGLQVESGGILDRLYPSPCR